jgi:hypothetical protein
LHENKHKAIAPKKSTTALFVAVDSCSLFGNGVNGIVIQANIYLLMLLLIKIAMPKTISFYQMDYKPNYICSSR